MFMGMIVFFLFLVLVTIVAFSFALSVCIAIGLRARHPQIHKDFGPPGLFGGPSLKRRHEFMDFILSVKYKNIDDPNIQKLGNILNGLIYTFLVLFLLFWVLTLSSQTQLRQEESIRQRERPAASQMLNSHDTKQYERTVEAVADRGRNLDVVGGDGR